MSEQDDIRAEDAQIQVNENSPQAQPAEDVTSQSAADLRKHDAHSESNHPSHDTMDVEHVHDDDEWPEVWNPPVQLDAPPPRPGMRQRWVRVAIGDKEDVKNVARMNKQGWRPRRVETVPGNFAPDQLLKQGRFEGCIGAEGLVLCEMPEALAKQRDAYYRDKRNRQMEGVDRQMHAAAQASSQFGNIVKEESNPTRVGKQPKVAS